LRLKIGCPIIILRNLQPHDGVCNGSRSVVTQISRRVIEVRLFTNQTVLIPRIKLISKDTDGPFVLQRLQFPLALAFAMTINKAQGQSFQCVGIDLRVPVFAHGQLYVAFSRSKSRQGVKCIFRDDNEDGKTKNIVYCSVILP
jgi:ATP-dependent exoDNAse (exonuclease V) alpha subunit